MGIETIVVLFLGQLIQLSDFMGRNAALISFVVLFLAAWLTGVITIVRRWRAE